MTIGQKEKIGQILAEEQEEPLPVVAGWPDAQCEYVKFTDSYTRPADRTRAMGWTYREFDAGHFHMLVAPEDVATALTDVMPSGL